jgi:hypothetical protein
MRFGGHHFLFCAMGLRTFIRTGTEGNWTMRRIKSLLTPSRIRQRLAEIVAIAAASLPAAGA